MDENIARQLQVLLKDPVRYKRLARGQGDEVHIYPPYWRQMPTYQISRCPFSSLAHQEMLDTYTLFNWSIRYGGGARIAFATDDPVYSDHFVAVQAFLNLEGYKPAGNELMDGVLHSESPEVPFITPGLLPDDMESYAVMHALPVGKIKGDGFIPRYTLYILTYYAADPAALLQRRWETWTRGRKMTTQMNWYAVPRTDYWELAEQNPEMWDLSTWVRRGKLQWLDVADAALRLRTDVEAFPYGSIRGLRHGFRYTPRQPVEIVYSTTTLEQFHRTAHFFADE